LGAGSLSGSAGRLGLDAAALRRVVKQGAD
jgi:hypothetical protein